MDYERLLNEQSQPRIHRPEDIEDPIARQFMLHLRAMKKRDFGRFCALCDLLNLVQDEDMPMSERQQAQALLMMDMNGDVDRLREAYMRQHDGKDGTEYTEEEMKAHVEIQKALAEAQPSLSDAK